MQPRPPPSSASTDPIHHTNNNHKQKKHTQAGTAYGLTESYGPSTLHIPDDPAEYPGISAAEQDGQLQARIYIYIYIVCVLI